MTHSIRFKIMLYIALCICLFLAISSSIAYYQAEKSLEKEILNSIKITGNKTSNFISAWLDSRKKLLSSAASHLTENNDQKITTIIEHVQKAGDFISAYVGRPEPEDNTMLIFPKSDLPAGFNPTSRPWYIRAQAEKKLIITPPYRDVLGGMILSIAKPLPFGVLAADISLNQIEKEILTTSLGGDSFSALIDKDNNFLVHPDKKQLNKNLNNHISSELNIKDNQINEVQIQNQTALMGVFPVAGTDWKLILILNQAQIFSALNNLLISNIMTSIITIIMVSLVSGLIIHTLLKPLKELNSLMSNIAKGDADLTTRLKILRQDEIGILSQSFNIFISSIHQLVSHCLNSALSLNKVAESVKKNSTINAQAIKYQQEEISQIAVAANELSSTSSEVASNAKGTAEVSKRANIEGKSGLKNAEENNQRMHTLETSIEATTDIIQKLDTNTEEITNILTTIEGIAEQTNLLALNAAIEAARAGEQGRGFAVVADEVRSLSKRTQNATEEIQNMLEGLKAQSSHAAKMMQHSKQLTGETMSNANAVLDSFKQIFSTLNEVLARSETIANSCKEQHLATEEINRIVTAIQESTQTLSGNVEKSTEESNNLHALSADINHNLSSFKL